MKKTLLLVAMALLGLTHASDVGIATYHVFTEISTGSQVM